MLLHARAYELAYKNVSIRFCDQLRSRRLAYRSTYIERPTAREMRPYQTLPVLLACSCLVFPIDGEGEPSTICIIVHIYLI